MAKMQLNTNRRSILNNSSSKTLFSSFNQKPLFSSLIELHHRLRLTMAEICRRHLGTAAKRLVSRLGVSSSLQSRSFGAAAVQVQYDDEDEYDEMYEDRRSQMIVPREESTDSILGRGVHWVFMGNPSAMKRVYAEKLSKILQVPHISMGSLVRQELNPHSSLYKQIANSVNQGKLVTEDIIFGLLSKRLEEGHSKGEAGFILDGIPRTILQAEILDEITDIDLVVNFKCTGDCSAKKHMGSGICSYCQECLGKGNSVSSSLNLQLKNTQLNHSNTDEARKEKLRIHSEQRKPLEDYYRRQKKILDFQVASAPGETWQGLLSALHLKHVNAIHSSHELIA